MSATFSAALDEETNSVVTMRLYKNVKNVPELRNKIVAGTLPCCIIKPALIVNPLQIVMATNKAAVSEHNKQLTTRSIYTEILFNLSISKNISQSLLKFGIDDKESNFIVVLVQKLGSMDENDIVFNQIEGDLQDFDELQNLTDDKLVKKAYKIQDEETQVSSLLHSVVSRIATKDFVSH